MIDLHCHILPGIDDGAQNADDTLTMLKSAIEEGITVITASPHHNPEYHNESSIILDKVREVEEIISQNNLPIKVLPGQEVRAYGELLEDYSDGKLLTSAGNTHYMLVEFPSNHVPKYAEQLFYDMALEGLQPILVHPERNGGIIDNPEILYNFVSQGVLSQVTASSITGHFGKRIQKLSFQMIENKLTHFVASDAHNVTTRAFKMKDAYRLISSKYGRAVVGEFKMNASQVINDEMIYPEAPSIIKEKKLFKFF